MDGDTRQSAWGDRGPPSPTTTPTTGPTGEGLQQSGIFLAGFMDCTEETLRYLTDVECLPESNSIIMGLREHLRLKQQRLQSQNNANNDVTTHHEVQGHSGNPRDLAQAPISDDFESSLGCDIPFPLDSDSSAVFSSTAEDSSVLESSGCLETTGSSDQQSPDTSINDIQMDTSGEDVSHGIPPFDLIQSGYPQSSCLGSGIASVSSCRPEDVNVALEAFDLAKLTQNNPAIASLTRELFQLLEEESSDADVQEDSEEEEEEVGTLRRTSGENPCCNVSGYDVHRTVSDNGNGDAASASARTCVSTTRL